MVHFYGTLLGSTFRVHFYGTLLRYSFRVHFSFERPQLPRYGGLVLNKIIRFFVSYFLPLTAYQVGRNLFLLISSVVVPSNLKLILSGPDCPGNICRLGMEKLDPIQKELH